MSVPMSLSRRRIPLRRMGVMSVVGVLLIGSAVPVLAVNEFAEAGRETPSPSNIYDGIRGKQEIRTNPATVSGVAYVHHNQVRHSSGDFIAIGTYMGLGAVGTGGGSSCSNDYDADWSIYTDGEFTGVYFCLTIAQDVYVAGSNPAFSVAYAWCPSSLSYRWVLALGGTNPASATIRDCRTTGWTAGDSVRSGLETCCVSTDRDIDVKYTQMKYNLNSGSTWYSIGNPSDTYGYKYVDFDYRYTFVSNEAFNVYLTPLN